MPRKWDDWRCYRCNRWRPSAEPKTMHLTPAGIMLGVCPSCVGQCPAAQCTLPRDHDGAHSVELVPQ